MILHPSIIRCGTVRFFFLNFIQEVRKKSKCQLLFQLFHLHFSYSKTLFQGIVFRIHHQYITPAPPMPDDAIPSACDRTRRARWVAIVKDLDVNRLLCLCVCIYQISLLLLLLVNCVRLAQINGWFIGCGILLVIEKKLLGQAYHFT